MRYTELPKHSTHIHTVVSKPAEYIFIQVFYGRATKPGGAVVWKDLSLLIEY